VRAYCYWIWKAKTVLQTSNKVIELMFISMFRDANFVYLLMFFVLCREGYPKCSSCPKEYSSWCCWPCSEKGVSLLHVSICYIHWTCYHFCIIRLMFHFGTRIHHLFVSTEKQRENIRKSAFSLGTSPFYFVQNSLVHTLYLCLSRYCIGRKKNIKWKSWRRAS